MPAPDPIIPLSELDLENPLFGPEEIRQRNRHRHEMELLDAIVHLDAEAGVIAGLKRVRDDQFWVRGHFPHQAIFPGVLMLESGGQLCSFYSQEVRKHGKIMVFAAANDVRFRGMVEPGDDLIMLGKMIAYRTRATRFKAQGWVKDRLVFESEITGMMIDS